MTDLDTDDGIRDAIRTIATWGGPGTTWSHELGLARVHPLPARVRRWKRPLLAVAAVTAVAAILAGTLNLGSGPTVVAASRGTWAPMASSPLAPRQDAIGLWTGTEVLISGGKEGDTSYLDGARYDPSSDAWRRMAPLPDASEARVVHLGAWTGQEAVYVVGYPDVSGTYGYGAQDYDLMAYDPATNSWRTLLQARFDPDAPSNTVAALAPVPIEAPDVLAVVGGHLVMAGWQASTSSYGWTTLDPSAGTWDEVHRLPDQRDFLQGTGKVTQVVGGQLFLALARFGFNPGDDLGFLLDPTSGTTTAVNLPPASRPEAPYGNLDMRGSVAGGALVLVGNLHIQGRVVREAWKFDMATREWSPATPPPDGFVGDEDAGVEAVVSTDAGVVVLGGLDHPGNLIAPNGRLIPVDGGVRLALDPSASRWAELPEPPIDLHRVGVVAVWTGTEIVVWGGTSASRSYPGSGSVLDDGARFRIDTG